MMESMNRLRFLAAALCAASLLAHSEIRTEAEVQPGTPEVVQKARRAPPAHVAQTRLAPFTAPKATQPEKRGIPTQVGYSRDVDALSSVEAVRDALAWESLANRGRPPAPPGTSPGAGGPRPRAPP